MNILTKHHVFVLLLFLFDILAGSESSVAETKLQGKLLDNYNKLARPAKNSSEPVIVKFAVTVMQIVGVCEADSVLKTNIWLTLEWNDAGLTWDPQDYENITSVRIPPSKIWMPDIYCYNSAAKSFDTTFPTDVVVRSDGNLTYITPGIFETTCKFAYNYFPFEHQRCEIKFGSWTYDGGMLDFQLQDGEDNGAADVSSFVPHPEWNLISVNGRRNAIYYACCPEPYVDITFVFTMNRKIEAMMMEAKTFNMFIFTTMFLSFLIPAASAHKITFAILHVVNAYYPLWCYVSRFPKLFVETKYGFGPLIFYFQLVGMLGGIGLIANILTVWIWHKRGRMPDRMRKLVVEKMYKILFLSGHLEQKNFAKKQVDANGVSGSMELQPSPTGKVEQVELSDWQFLANIVDRCFFFLFVVVSVIVWVALFPTIPSP